MDLNQFVDWVKEKPRRQVTIELNPVNQEEFFNIWVYDYDLMQGQRVESVSEIDLEARKAEQEMAEYERLKAKFDPELGKTA